MRDGDKTKEQLIAELVDLRQQIIGLKKIQTKCKELEEAVEEERRTFFPVLQKAPYGIALIDRDGDFLYINPEFTKITGYSLVDIHTGRDWFLRAFIFPEDRQKFIETWKGDIIHKGTERVLQFICKEGEIKEIEFKPTVLEDGRMIVMLSDITERKKAEEALKTERQRFKTLSENAPFGMVMVERDGAFRYINPKFKELFGYDLDDIPDGKTWFRKAYPEPGYRHNVIATWIKDLEDFPSGEKRPRTLTVTCKDGAQKIINFISVQLRTGENLIACEDITERNRVEQEKSDLQEQLRQSQKMEAIGRLAGGIAHDFNNVLQVIKGYSELSLLDLKEGDPTRESIKEIAKSANRAADLTHQLLAFSRRQLMEMKVIYLNTLLVGLDKMLRRVIGEDIELVTLFAPELGKVKADPGQIEQVILNLVVNARDAMPYGGKLIIETADTEIDDACDHSHAGVNPGHYVILSVSDTGVGMTPEVKGRIFEPFFTTKEKGKGTGLGLSTVYGIVKQSGGEILVDSQPGQGTTFKIYLPKVDEPLEELIEKTMVEKFPCGGETVMVVEDEKEVRELTVRILKREGYNTLTASDGFEALHVIEQHDGLIKLMITDIVMPRMNGYDLVKRIMPLHSGIKVLYMSGYPDNEVVHRCASEVGNGYIKKPFTLDGLVRRIRQVLDG